MVQIPFRELSEPAERPSSSGSVLFFSLCTSDRTEYLKHRTSNAPPRPTLPRGPHRPQSITRATWFASNFPAAPHALLPAACAPVRQSWLSLSRSPLDVRVLLGYRRSRSPAPARRMVISWTSTFPVPGRAVSGPVVGRSAGEDASLRRRRADRVRAGPEFRERFPQPAIPFIGRLRPSQEDAGGDS